jgi:Uma2 family endonuclease
MASAEDLYRLPEDGRHYELVHGRLISEPAPGGRHGVVAATVARLLGNYVAEHRTGVVLSNDTGFILHRSPDTVRAPDVAYLRRERYLALEDDWLMIPGAPDLAIEVLSPSNRESDIHAKVADYLAAGTSLVWVIDARVGAVHSYRQLLQPEVLTGSDQLSAQEMLPGFSVTVATIFEI